MRLDTIIDFERVQFLNKRKIPFGLRGIKGYSNFASSSFPGIAIFNRFQENEVLVHLTANSMIDE
jgi:hypothetical protein